jgi:hypothetical protein
MLLSCGHCNNFPGCCLCKHLNANTVTGQTYRRIHLQNPPAVMAAIITDRPSAGPISLPCIYQGQDTGEEITCPSCQGIVQLKVKQCSKHGECTVGKPVEGKACCMTCPDKEVNFVRNLLYYIYPRQGSIWRWNILKLLERIALFDGQRVVAIATDRTTDPYDHVQNALEGHGIKYIHLENDPSLREVKAFEELFSHVETDKPNEVTLFAHAKGVTKSKDSTAFRWTESLYELHMDYWPLVNKLLAKQPLVGAWKKIGKGWPEHESKSDWHYSSSWLWFRNKDLFSRNWKLIDQNQWGIEPYPSLHFRQENAACIFPEQPLSISTNLYQHSFWDGIASSLQTWRENNKQYRWEVPYEPAS